MSFLYFLEGLRTPLLDKIFQFITYFGQELIVVAAVCILYWCLDKKLAYKAAFSYFAAGLMVQALKITFRIPRPWILDPNFKPVPSAVPAATGYSFPSGHTQASTSLFGTIAFAAKKRWVKILCIATFLLVGLSRMYLGVHTPKDVLAAMAIALVTAYLVNRLFDFYWKKHSSDKWTALLMLAISALVIGYALVLYHNGIIEFRYAEDCCKAAGAGLGFSIGWYLERTTLNFCPQASLPIQFLKVVIGLACALLLQNGLKLLSGTTLPAHVLRYFLLVLWVIYLYPLLFTRGKRQSPT